MQTDAQARWIAPVFLPHAGCPHRCVFCDQRRIAFPAGPPDPEQVRDRLRLLFSSRGRRPARRRQIAFYGGSFTALDRGLQEAYLEAGAPYLRDGRADSIRLSTRPDGLGGDRLPFLRSRGVGTVELGVQSFSDAVLRASGRGHNGRTAEEGIRRVKQEGLEVGAQLMFGLPGDTGAEGLASVERLCALRPDFVRLYPVLVLRGTELSRMMARGDYRPLALEEAVDLCARALDRFDRSGIPVIRIGLQTHEGLRPGRGALVAGPHHPAFGDLVRSAWFQGRVLDALPGGRRQGRSLRLRIHPHDRSLLVGHGGWGMERVRSSLGGRPFPTREDARLARGEVMWDVEEAEERSAERR